MLTFSAVWPGFPGSKPTSYNQVVVIVPRTTDSPLGRYESVKWLDVMRHMVDRLAWADPRFSLAVYTEDALEVP